MRTATKKVRYASPRPRQRAAVPPLSPEEALLAKLRKLAASGKEMSQRSLRDEIDPAAIYQLAQARPELLTIVGDGRTHRIVLRSAAQAAAQAGPPRSEPQIAAQELPSPEIEEPPVPDLPEVAEPLPVAALPGAPLKICSPPPLPEPRTRQEGLSAYEQLVAQCKAAGPSNRRGGREAGRRRTRHPLIDIETGQSLEFQNAEEGRYIEGIGKKRYGRKYLLRLAKLQAPALKPAPAKPEPMPPRHRMRCKYRFWV